MKVSKRHTGLVLGLALLLATSAFAANKGSLQVSDPITVSGKQLAPGEYKVTWDGAGPNVELNIMRGKSVIATVPARVVSLDRASNSDAAVVSTSGDGGRSLSEIRFSGKKFALAIGGETAKAEAGSN